MRDSDFEKAEQLQLEKLNHSIEKARNALAQSSQPTGFCLNCEEPLPEGDRFCDKDCASDFEKYGNHT